MHHAHLLQQPATAEPLPPSDPLFPPLPPHRQVYVIVVTLVTIALWCSNSFLEQFTGAMGILAIVPMVAFFGGGALGKDDFNGFLWNVVMLAMGGLALGEAVKSSGLLMDVASGGLGQGLGVGGNFTNGSFGSKAEDWQAAGQQLWPAAGLCLLFLCLMTVGYGRQLSEGSACLSTFELHPVNDESIVKVYFLTADIRDAVDGLDLWTVLAIFCGLILVMTTFISHTVGAMVILPIVQSVGEQMPGEHHPKLLVMCAALMCSGERPLVRQALL